MATVNKLRNLNKFMRRFFLSVAGLLIVVVLGII